MAGNAASQSHTRYNLSIYSGDTGRETQAKSLQLEAGQQIDGDDLTVPVSKLHALTGALLDSATGQPINAGHLELVYADDGKSLNTVAVDPETRSFTFSFVPEGVYRLRTKDAREVRYEGTSAFLSDDALLGGERKSVTLRQYAPAETPVILQGEMGGVNLAVKAEADKQQ